MRSRWKTCLVVSKRQLQQPLLNALDLSYNIENITSDFICGNISIVYCTLRQHAFNRKILEKQLEQLNYACERPLSVVVLCLVDVDDGTHTLTSINKLCTASNCILFCVHSLREASSYVHALYSAAQGYTNNHFTDTEEHEKTITSILCILRGINKVDAKSLCQNHSSFADLCTSIIENFCVCPGIGTSKLCVLSRAIRMPFSGRKCSTA
jgi:DNA excision repair protein ERCC-1